MASQLDLDQGGTFRQWVRSYLGPSVGWVFAPHNNILSVTSAGTTVLQLGTTLVEVNVVGLVTIQLPLSASNNAGAQAVPGSFIGAPITVVDVGGNALGTNITIVPSGSETIDGLTSLAITINYGSYTFQPNTPNAGYTVRGM